MATVRISRCLFLQLCIIIVVYTIVASEACFAVNERLDFSGLLSEICKTKSSTHLLLAAGHVGDMARYTAGGGEKNDRLSSRKCTKTRDGEGVREMENCGKRQDGWSDRSLIRHYPRKDLKNHDWIRFPEKETAKDRGRRNGWRARVFNGPVSQWNRQYWPHRHYR